MNKFFLTITLLICGLNLSFSQDSLTSGNFKSLKTILKANPEMDTNNDNILTEKEYRDYQLLDVSNKRKFNIKGYYSYNKDIPYAGTENERQTLDIITPVNKAKKQLPVVIFIHGGGWKNGSKAMALRIIDPFLATGDYIGVSVNYRLSGEAKWPAQLYDCKAAIRWVKANAKTYGIDKDEIAVWGTSAGGHITAMLSVTSNNKEFEGTLGNHLDKSSAVTCAIDGFGPKDFLMEKTVSVIPELVNNNFKGSNYNVYNLLDGGEELKEKARIASPFYHINSEMAPLFIYHGTADPLVNMAHSELFYDKAIEQGISKVYLTKVEGLKHEPKIPKDLKARLFKFLEIHLYDKKEFIENSTEVAIDD